MHPGFNIPPEHLLLSNAWRIHGTWTSFWLISQVKVSGTMQIVNADPKVPCSKAHDYPFSGESSLFCTDLDPRDKLFFLLQDDKQIFFFLVHAFTEDLVLWASWPYSETSCPFPDFALAQGLTSNACEMLKLEPVGCASAYHRIFTFFISGLPRFFLLSCELSFPLQMKFIII